MANGFTKLHLAGLWRLTLIAHVAFSCPSLYPDMIGTPVMQYVLASGDFIYVHVDGCKPGSGCSGISYSIKSNSPTDDDSQAPKINVYGFNRANLMAFATAGTTTGAVSGFTQSNVICTDVTDVTGPPEGEDPPTLASYSATEALYLVIECPASGNGCDVEAAIKWTAGSTVGQCSAPKELDSAADNVRNTIVSPGGKWVSPAIKPCGTGGCTSLKYSLVSWGAGSYDFVALDVTNKALFESGQAYTALDVTGLKSQTDVICASGKGITTPANTNKVYLGLTCRSAASSCGLSFFIQFTGNAAANDDGVDDYPVGDDDTIGKECENAIVASGVTLTPATVTAGKFHIIPVDGCGSTGCTDMKIAAQSTDTSIISMYALNLYDLIGLLAGGYFVADQSEPEVDCGYKDGFASSTVAGSHYFLALQCVTGKSSGGACKIDAGYSRVAGTGSSDDDDGAASCVDPATNFAAADVKSQTIESGKYHTITLSDCGSSFGKCTNVKWAVKSDSDTFAVLGLNEAGYNDVTSGNWNLVRYDEVLVPWSSCHGDVSGNLAVGDQMDNFYVIIVCLNDNGVSCNVDYALTYDAYVQPSNTPEPTTDDAVFDDDGDWSDCVDPSVIGTKASYTLMDGSWDAWGIEITGCTSAVGCREIKYSVKTSDGSEIHVYALTGTEAAKLRQSGDTTGLTTIFEAHKQTCVSDASGTLNGPIGESTFVLALFCFKPVAGFCAVDYVIEALLPSPSPSPTGTTAPSASGTPPPTPSGTNIPPSQTPGSTPSSTGTPTGTSAPSTSPSGSVTPSATPSVSLSASATPSASSGQTVTATPTPSVTSSASATPSISVSPSSSFSATPSPSTSVSSSPSATPSATKSPGASVSPSASVSISATPSATPSSTGTLTATPSPSITPSATRTPAPTATATPRHCPDTAAVFPGASAVSVQLSANRMTMLSLGRDVHCTSASQCTGTRFIVENIAAAGLPRALFDVLGMSLADYRAFVSGAKQLADLRVYPPFEARAAACVWQGMGLVTPVLAAPAARQLQPTPVWSRALSGPVGADEDEFVIALYCRQPDSTTGQCNLRYVAQAAPGFDANAPPSPTPTPAPAGEQPCPLSPASVALLSDSSHTTPDPAGGASSTRHESSAPALLTAQAGTFIVVDLFGCDTPAGCTDLAVAVRLANAKPSAGGTTVETGRRFTVAGMTGTQLSQFLSVAATPGWDRTIPATQAVTWRSDDLTRCFPPAPASRRAAALLARALYGAQEPAEAGRTVLRLGKGQRLWVPAGDGLALDNDGTGAGWASSADAPDSGGGTAAAADASGADISTPAARRALAAAAGMPTGTTTTPSDETFHVVLACEPDAAGAETPDFCALEHAVAYVRTRQSVSPGGRVDTGSVVDDDLVLEEPDAGSGSGGAYGSTQPGDVCGADGECSTFACRGGFCCDAAAIQADSGSGQGSAVAACAVCAAGDGGCVLRSGDAIGACPTSCDDESATLACGARSDGSFFCGKMYNSTGGAIGIAGHCTCGDEVVSWTTIGVDPIFGIPSPINCASTALAVCPAIADAAVRRSGDARKAAAANPAGGGLGPAPNDDGAGLAVGLGFVGVLALVGAGWFGVSYVRTRRPDWAVERGLVPAFSDADIAQRRKRVSRLNRRTRWEVHAPKEADDLPPEDDVLSEMPSPPSPSPSETVNPLAALAPDSSKRSQRVLLSAGRGV